MTGKEADGKALCEEGEGRIRGRRDCSSGFFFFFFLVLLLGSVVLGNHSGGTELLGVLGMGARIPFGFLELGSGQAAPSWLGG
jgi:hypothetical protein